MRAATPRPGAIRRIRLPGPRTAASSRRVVGTSVAGAVAASPAPRSGERRRDVGHDRGWSQRWERTSSRRLQGAGVVVVLLACLLGGRLIQLQAVQADAYAQTALTGRMQEQSLPATRGAILDSTGQVLASSAQVRNVVADQTLVLQPHESALALAGLLGMDVPVVEQKLSGSKRFIYVAKKVQPQTWRQIAALKLPGITSEVVSNRTYVGGELAANVLGFVGVDGHGLEGLERTLDSQLAGVAGHAESEVDAGGRQIPLGLSRETPAVPGKDVQLTLNRAIQWKAQTALQQALQEWDAENGTVVVMDAGTGNILALATSPTYDPNRPGEFPAEVRGDRSVSQVYEPGSTGKVITAAAALQEGVVSADSIFAVPDHIDVGGIRIRDHEPHPVEAMTLTGIMAHSSNVGMIQVSQRLSQDSFARYYRAFGIGSRTGVQLPAESAGIFPPVSQWRGSTGPSLAFGQGYSVTTLQMASVFATIANGGVKMTPRIIAALDDGQGHWVPTPIPAGTRVVSAQTAQTVNDMLEQIPYPQGTAPKASIAGYRVAGKTGTAQRVNTSGSGFDGYTASFIGYAPADADPAKGKLVVSVTVHGPQKGMYGAQIAAPVFAQVMSFALQTLAIPPTGVQRPVMALSAGR